MVWPSNTRHQENIREMARTWKGKIMGKQNIGDFPSTDLHKTEL
jgi:hypothetical protein